MNNHSNWFQMIPDKRKVTFLLYLPPYYFIFNLQFNFINVVGFFFLNYILFI